MKNYLISGLVDKYRIKTKLYAISPNHAIKVFQQKYPKAEDIYVIQNLLKKMKRILFFFLVLLALPTSIKSDVWIDEDGTTAIEINENGIISFFDTGSFYYFDQIFGNVRKNKIKLNLCLGFPQKGMPSDCFKKLPSNFSVHNNGKTRALHVDLSHYPFLTSAFEKQLRLGKTMEISIDDEDLYSSFSLNKDHKLKKESIEIFRLLD